MYTITTFPNGKLTKDITKAEAGRKCIQGQIESFDNIQDLASRAAEVPISPSNLKDGKRAAANFVSADIIVVDVDEMMSLQECVATLDAQQVEFAIYTSFSHSKENNKFHVIIPLSERITNIDDYKATYDAITSEVFGSVNDGQTSSVANLFFNANPNTLELSTHQDSEDMSKAKVVRAASKSVVVSKKDVVVPNESLKINNLSKRTLRFLNAGAESGQWHNEIKLAAKNMKSAQYTKEECREKLLEITGSLTEADEYQINYAYKNNSWDYKLEVLGKETHPLRARYTDPTNGKPINIPVREIVKAFIEERNVTITAGGNIKSGVNDTDLGILKEYIRDFAETELNSKVNLSVIESVISSFREEQRLKQLLQLKDRIHYNGAKFDYEEWCMALLGKVDPIVITIMKHFIWQIKRKLADKEVKYPIMPVFYGKSGAGKSYHLRHHILKPIKDIVYFDGDFRKLVDSREAYNLASHYVYFLDEMSKAEHADVETIKNKITSDTIQYRKLGTNETVRSTNRVTFVGTSNLPLNNVIKDPTSVRRFFEIKILEKMDFDKISSLDYQAMWQSIDESINEDPYYISAQEEITALQETFRHKSVIEEFLLEIPFSADKDLEGEKLTRKEIYDIFKTWVGDSGYRHPINKHTFSQAINEKIGEPFRYRVGNEFLRGYTKIKTEEL